MWVRLSIYCNEVFSPSLGCPGIKKPISILFPNNFTYFSLILPLSLFLNQCIKVILQPNNSITCLKLDRPSAMIVYAYYINKLCDLIETLFFIVKKSWRQVTFLHVYHHISVIGCNYIDIYLQPGNIICYLLTTYPSFILYCNNLIIYWFWMVNCVSGV